MKRPVGVIFVMNAELNAGKQFVINRIHALAEQMKAADIEEIYLVPLIGSRRYLYKCLPWLKGIEGTKLAKSSQLPGIVKGRTMVGIDQSQYHVSSEWILRLVGLAENSDLVQAPEGPTSNPPNQLNHQRIKAAFLVAPASESEKITCMYRDRDIDAVAIEPSLKARGIPHEIQEVSQITIGSLYRRSAEMDLPVNFSVELNSSCNYHCLMCVYHGGRQNKSPAFIKPGTATEMPIDKFKDIIDDFASIDRPYEDPNETEIWVTPYHRGELLMHPHWREGLSHIKSKGYKIYISTNGSLWTEDDIEYLIDIGVDRIQVSINGFDIETHRKIRLNDEYEKTAWVAQQIVARRIRKGKTKPIVQAAHITNDRTEDDLQKYVNYWLQRVDAIDISPENFHSAETKNKRYMAEHLLAEAPTQSMRPPCSMVKDYLMIHSEGEGKLCIGSEYHKNGNIFDHNSVSEMMNSDFRSKVIDMHSSGELDNEFCNQCQQWYSLYYYDVETTEDYTHRIGPATRVYERHTPPPIVEPV